MPEVSTTIVSKPATLHAAITSGRAWLISLPKSRVARLRMKTRGPALHGPIAVHADTVAEQRAAALAPRRVDTDHHRDAQRIALVEAQAADQFVCQAGLAGPASAGDAQYRNARAAGRGMQPGFQCVQCLAVSSAVTSWASARHAPSVCPCSAVMSFGACTDRSWSARMTI